LLIQPALHGRQRHRQAGTKPPPTPCATCIDRMGPKEKAACVQETTSSPTSAPAGCMIRPLAPKDIGNCTILLSIQIGVKGGHDTQQGLCQLRSSSGWAPTNPAMCHTAYPGDTLSAKRSMAGHSFQPSGLRPSGYSRNAALLKPKRLICSATPSGGKFNSCPQAMASSWA